jgi:hypothetical protein
LGARLRRIVCCRRGYLLANRMCLGTDGAEAIEAQAHTHTHRHTTRVAHTSTSRQHQKGTHARHAFRPEPNRNLNAGVGEGPGPARANQVPAARHDVGVGAKLRGVGDTHMRLRTVVHDSPKRRPHRM